MAYTPSHETKNDGSNLADRPAFPVTYHHKWVRESDEGWYSLRGGHEIRVDVYLTRTYPDRPWMVVLTEAGITHAALFRGDLEAALITSENRLREVANRIEMTR